MIVAVRLGYLGNLGLMPRLELMKPEAGPVKQHYAMPLPLCIQRDDEQDTMMHHVVVMTDHMLPRVQGRPVVCRHDLRHSLLPGIWEGAA